MMSLRSASSGIGIIANAGKSDFTREKSSSQKVEIKLKDLNCALDKEI